MTNITKTNRFKTFRKKYRKDEAVQEVLDYIPVRLPNGRYFFKERVAEEIKEDVSERRG